MHIISNGVSIFQNGVRIFPNGVRIFSNGVSIFPNGVRVLGSEGGALTGALLVHHFSSIVHQLSCCFPTVYMSKVYLVHHFPELPVKY